MEFRCVSPHNIFYRRPCGISFTLDWASNPHSHSRIPRRPHSGSPYATFSEFVFPLLYNLKSHIRSRQHGQATQSRRFVASSSRTRTYYEVLGVAQKASPTDIKSAYYKLSKLYHPDINRGDDAAYKFREISEAYETLGNVQLRQTYDESLWTGARTSGSASHHSYRPNRYRETEMPGFDERYNAFRAQTARKQSRPPPPTGKTQYYDFDEFYRQHYQDVREREYNERYWRSVQENMVNQNRRNQVHNLSGFAWLVFFISFILLLKEYIIEGDKLSPEQAAKMRREQEQMERERWYSDRIIRDKMRDRIRNGYPYAPSPTYDVREDPPTSPPSATNKPDQEAPVPR